MEMFLFYGVIIVVFVVSAYVEYQRQDEAKAPWRALAAKHNLNFAEGKFMGKHAHVYGRYRGHHLTLETIAKSQGKRSITYTQISLLSDRLPQRDEPNLAAYPIGKSLSVEAVTRLLSQQALVHCNSCSLKVNDYDKSFVYEQRGIETDPNTLIKLFELLSDLADHASTVMALGNDVLPTLQQMADDSRNPLRHVAGWLLERIAANTRARLAHHTLSLFCPTCLTHCGEQIINRAWWRSLTIYGCRTCRQSRTFCPGHW